MTLYALVDPATNIVQWAGYQAPSPVPKDLTLITTTDTRTNALGCLQAPTHYQWTGTAFAPLPAWNLTFTGSKVTATLNQDPAPTTATLSIAGVQLPASITHGQASWPITLDPTIQPQQVWVQVTASGTIPGHMNLGGSATTVGLQYLPDSSTIAPGGPGSRAYLRAFYFGVADPAALLEQLTLALQSLYLTAAITLDLVGNVLLPWALTQSNPPTLPTATATALHVLAQQVLPNLLPMDASVFQTDGSLTPAFIELQQQSGPVTQALEAYMHAVTTLPNLG